MKAGPGFLYSLLIFGLICLFIFSGQEEKPRLHRRYLPGALPSGLRAAGKHEPVAFDPLIAAMDRKREDRAWEKEYWTHQYRSWAQQAQHWVSHPNLNLAQNLGNYPPPVQSFSRSDVPSAAAAESQPSPWENFNHTEYEESEEYAGEDYLNSDRFNISHRLEILFPQIDTNPKDGFVSLTELQFWHELSALRLTHQRTERDVEIHDMNRDGVITFSEYLPHFTAEDIEKNDMEVGGAGWWREQFQNADGDGNDVLNSTEFHDFLHPEDSRVEKIHRWLVRQELRIRSRAHGSNLTWDDFHRNVFDVIRDYGAEESAPELAHLNPYRDMEARKEILSKAKFEQLDSNKDEFLTEDEAEPLMNMLRPGELYYARVQAEHLMDQADDNRDGRLSLDEMLTHPYVFYNTAYDHGDDDSYTHDEFR